MAEIKTEDTKPGFFGDITSRLLLITGGLLSMATIVPMFINNIHRIFHLGILPSYVIFIIFYFIIPLILFLIYYIIVNKGHDLGYLDKAPPNKIWIWMLFLCVIIVSYIYFSSKVYIILVSILVLYFILGTLGVLYIRSKKALEKDPAKKIYFTEFKIVAGSIVFLFVLLYTTNYKTIGKNIFNSNNVKKSDSAFLYFKYAKELDTIAAKMDTLQITCYRNAAIAYIYNEHAKNQKPCDSTQNKDKKSKDKKEAEKRKPDCDSVKAEEKIFDPLIKLIKRVEDSISYADKFVKSFDYLRDHQLKKLIKPDTTNTSFIYDAFKKSIFLKDIAHQTQLSGQEKVKERWAILINQLQYKGLIWLMSLVVLSLCFWLGLTYKLADLQSVKLKMPWQTDELTKITQSISQVKSFIYILLLLILPFFKHIDKSDIDLNKPFINFGPASFLPDESRGLSPQKNSSSTNCCDQLEIDRLLNNIENYEARLDSTGIIKRLDGLKGQINEHAKGTMRNPKTLDSFLTRYK